MPNPSDTETPRSSPPRSASTGTGPGPMPASPQNAIGTELGKTGSTAISLPSSELAAKMAGANPLRTIETLKACLPKSLAASLMRVTNTTYPAGQDVKIELLGFRLRLGVPDQDRLQALTLVRQSLRPMPESEATELLMLLKARTRGRNETDSDALFQLKVYAHDMLDFPADVVRYALTTWHENNDFWPTVHELLQVLRKWSHERQCLLNVLTEPLAEEGQNLP